MKEPIPEPSVDSKYCTGCNSHKPIDDFHRDKGKHDGRASRCRDCVNLKLRYYYFVNKESVDAKNEAWRKSNMERAREIAYRGHDPLKARARAAVNNAVNSGKINREDCRDCGETKTDFHHTDGYGKHNWFTGVWLCRPCHSAIHRKQRWGFDAGATVLAINKIFGEDNE